MKAVLVGFVTLVVVATSGGVGAAAYVCRMGAGTGSPSCCHHEQAKPERSRGPTITRAGCCEIRGSRRDSPDRVEVSSSPEPLPLAVTVSGDVPSPVRLHVTRVPRPQEARGPPGSWPPLFVQHCAYLI